MYLHQANKSYNFVGINAPSPFEVNMPVKKACPHLINVNAPMPDRVHWGLFMELYKDEFVQKFLPIPRKISDPVPFLADANNDRHMLLLRLSCLASPIYPVVERFDRFSVKQWEIELQTTNVCPLVLTGIETHQQADMEKLATIARRAPRRLILSGDPMLVITDPMVRMRTFADDLETEKLFSLPMENLGAVALRRHCRHEAIDSEWVKKT